VKASFRQTSCPPAESETAASSSIAKGCHFIPPAVISPNQTPHKLLLSFLSSSPQNYDFPLMLFFVFSFEILSFFWRKNTGRR